MALDGTTPPCANDALLIRKRWPEENRFWEEQLVGKRIVTADLAKARKSRIESGNPPGSSGMSALCDLFYPIVFFQNPDSLSMFDLDNALPSESRLLKLPAELRIQILEEALAHPRPITQLGGGRGFTARSWGGKQWLAISAVPVIFTCKQLYMEALPIALRNYTFKDINLPENTTLHKRDLSDVITCQDIEKHYEGLNVYFYGRWWVQEIVFYNHKSEEGRKEREDWAERVKWSKEQKILIFQKNRKYYG